jgi:elongation factor P hydroxylase
MIERAPPTDDHPARLADDDSRRPVAANDVASVFNALFRPGYCTEMRGGADEPLYLPATPTGPAQVIYRDDYAASALHEAAHWCIAGPKRRALIDYGYWYVPPPRTPLQQQQFFHHEVRVQAIELLFAAAAGVAFRTSHDDPDLDGHEIEQFALAVEMEAGRLTARGLPLRAAWFRDALANRFGVARTHHGSRR